MAKYHGAIGFEVTDETVPGVHKPIITEKHYSGDVYQNVKESRNGDGTVENIDVKNEISIVADPYANTHFHAMRYIRWMGANWEIKQVKVEFPRLRLTIGGVYNGETPTTP